MVFALFAWFACAGDLQETLEALILGACTNFAKFVQKWRAFALQFAPIGLGRVI